MTEFLINFLWYLAAFVVGAVVAWLISLAVVRNRSEDEAFADIDRAAQKGGNR